jgi:hypothetical protein
MVNGVSDKATNVNFHPVTNEKISEPVIRPKSERKSGTFSLKKNPRFNIVHELNYPIPSLILSRLTISRLLNSPALCTSNHPISCRRIFRKRINRIRRTCLSAAVIQQVQPIQQHSILTKPRIT